MATIAPFRGMTYNFNRLVELSRVVAPPYDVISEKEQEEYYQSDPYNVIKLILGKKKTGDSDWDNRYTRAADYLSRWEMEDVLIRSDYPCMYLSSLTYDPEDGRGPKVRWGLIALVQIEDEGSGGILPHERTFSAHKIDRLKLMRACNAQLSQIFSLYEDHENRVLSSLNKVINVSPQVSFDFKDGTQHQVWIIDDQSIFKEVAQTLHDKPILIADGHHRYETSRDFRNIMRARYGSRPPNRAYEFVMMYLTNMEDQGLTILPSHRLLKGCAGFELGPFLEKLEQWFEISEVPFSKSVGPERTIKLKSILEDRGRHTSAIGFYLHGGEKCYILSLKPTARDEMGDDLHPSLKKLDVLVLSRFIFQKSFGFSRGDLDDEEIFHFQSDIAKTISMVDHGSYQMAFLLNSTRIEHVKEVTGHSLIMPRKSTYFYPKVLTGLVFNKIDPYEIIQIS